MIKNLKNIIIYCAVTYLCLYLTIVLTTSSYCDAGLLMHDRSLINKPSDKNLYYKISLDTYNKIAQNKTVSNQYNFLDHLSILGGTIKDYGSLKIIKSSSYNYYTRCLLETENVLFINKNIKGLQSDKQRNKSVNLVVFIPGLNGLSVSQLPQVIQYGIRCNAHVLMVDYSGMRVSHGSKLLKSDKRLSFGVIYVRLKSKKYHAQYTESVMQDALSYIYNRPISKLEVFLKNSDVKIHLLSHSFGGSICQQLLRGVSAQKIYTSVMVSPALFRESVEINHNLGHKISILIVWGMDEQLLNRSGFFLSIFNYVCRRFGFQFSSNVQTRLEIETYRKNLCINSLVIELPFQGHSCFEYVLRNLNTYDIGVGHASYNL